MRKRSEIMSIFGEIEEIVAKQMMAEGKGIAKLAPTERVAINDCPASAIYNADGQKARMVIVVPSQLVMEFERRIEELRQ
jgi:hypothetical protein